MSPKPELLKIPANGFNFAVWHWKGTPGQQYLFVHATGFHGRCWDQVIAQFGEIDCFAMDLRGHGQSDKTEPPLQWREAGRDLAAVATALGMHNAVGIGHSMGGHSLCVAAALEPRLFSSLVLIDPVIQKEKFYRSAHEPEPDYASHPVARRRNQFASSEDMFEKYKDRPPFKRWNQTVFKDYCSYALNPAKEGDGFTLACAPLFEAAIYSESIAPSAQIYDDIKKIEIPVCVIRMGEERGDDEFNFNVSPTNPKLASYFKDAKDVHIKEYTHFMPMENPELTANLIKEFLASLNSPAKVMRS